MSEAGGSNIEIAQHLSEHSHPSQSLGHQILEIAEAAVLAVVAITTAWSGYQAALWTGHQAELYGQASKLRVQAEGAANFANQERLYNASTVVEWLNAKAHGDKKLADLFERRFLPEFRPAFEAWTKTDPLNNPNAPPGPQLMAEYKKLQVGRGGQVERAGYRGFRSRHSRPATFRRICASDRDAGDRATADRDQPALHDSCGARWIASARYGTGVFSGLPHLYATPRLEGPAARSRRTPVTARWQHAENSGNSWLEQSPCLFV